MTTVEPQGPWLTIECERAHYIDKGRETILCDRLPSPVTLVLKPTEPAFLLRWQKIETAPLDRPILAWWPHLERPVIAWISRGGSSIGKWTFASYKFEHQTPIVAPTLWAEMPVPPQDIAS